MAQKKKAGRKLTLSATTTTKNAIAKDKVSSRPLEETDIGRLEWKERRHEDILPGEKDKLNAHKNAQAAVKVNDAAQQAAEDANARRAASLNSASTTKDPRIVPHQPDDLAAQTAKHETDATSSVNSPPPTNRSKRAPK